VPLAQAFFDHIFLALPPGRHLLEATLAETGESPADSGAAHAVGRRITAETEVRPGQVLLELSTEPDLILR